MTVYRRLGMPVWIPCIRPVAAMPELQLSCKFWGLAQYMACSSGLAAHHQWPVPTSAARRVHLLLPRPVFFFQTISPNCLLPEMRNHKAVQAGRDLNKGSRCVPSEVTITPTQTSTPCLTELRPAGPIIGQSAFGTSISKHFWVIPRQQQHTKIVLLE